MAGNASGSLAGECRLGQMLRQFIIEKPTVPAMSLIRALAVLPFLGILGGTPFLNRVAPLILGLPLLFAWLLLWIVLTSGIMLVIYLCDPANRAQPLTGEPHPEEAQESRPGGSRPGGSRAAGSGANGSRASRSGANGSGANRSPAREAHP